MADITLDIVSQTITLDVSSETIALDTGGAGPTGLSGVTGEIVALSQTEYDALSPPDPANLYIITS